VPQEIIVDLAVLGAAIYSTWRLMPTALRRDVTGCLKTVARLVGVNEERAERLQSTLTRVGCGSCEGCGACRPAGPASVKVERLIRLHADERHRHY
jgi:hypothetical protein